MIPKKQKSFTLIEVLLAMVVLGLAVTSILTTFTASVVAGRISQDYALAAVLMEELKTHVRANLVTPFDVNQGTFSTHPEFSWQVDYYYTETDGLYQVEMRIGWTRASQQHYLNYQTYHYAPDSALGLEESTTEQSSTEGR